MIVEEIVRSSILMYSSSNRAIKALGDMSLPYFIPSKLIVIFFGLLLKAKWEMNSQMNSLNDLIELGFKVTYHSLMAK